MKFCVLHPETHTDKRKKLQGAVTDMGDTILINRGLTFDCGHCIVTKVRCLEKENIILTKRTKQNPTIDVIKIISLMGHMC